MAIAAGAAAETLPLGSTCPACADGKVQTAFEPETPLQRSGEPELPVDYTRITADALRGQTNVGVEAKGGVIIERNHQTVNAEHVSYNQKTDTVKADQGFILDDGESQVRGSTLDYNLSAA